MLTDDVQVISVDDHVVEHPNVWRDRLPEKYKEAGPFNSRDAEGRDAWTFEGEVSYAVGLNAVAGKKFEDIGLEPLTFDDMREGCYVPAERLKDMDADGIHAQLCFPSFPGFCGSRFMAAKDKDLAAACISAWNDWMIDEWAGEMPGRQIPLAIVPLWDIEKATAEAKRIIDRGARTISLTEAPHAIGLPSYHTDHWDPLLAVLNDAEVPMSVHFGSGGAPTVAAEAPFTTAIALYGLNSQMATVDLVNSQVFTKFPKLKVALSEGGIGWIPYILERCDYTWERHRWYTGMENSTKPSELFRKHLYGCFIADDAGLANLDLIGEDNVMFEGDYPHSDCNWPHARKLLAESLAHLPDATAAKVAEGNARKLFNFPRTS
ncbi:MAG: amidohydrolase [Ilumatobacteraceae bacterium]|nr:amidohydrolase [Ilumatobacteraceae bacterium]